MLFSCQRSKDSNNLSYKIDIKIYEMTKKKTEQTNADVVNLDNKIEIDKFENKEVKKEKNNIETKYPVNDKRFKNIDYIVRKTAHVALYTLFAITLTLFIKTFKIKNWKTILIVLIIGFLYACLDEYNQKLGGTRTGKFSDTYFDTAGCLIGSNIVIVVQNIRRKNNKTIDD